MRKLRVNRKPLAKMPSRSSTAAIGDIVSAITELKLLVVEHERRERALIGRWALPSGTVFRVKRIDNNGLALCTADARCWNVPVGQLLTLRERGELRWLGR